MPGDATFTVRPGGALTGELVMPGDKSISHRAVMLGALATGATRIRGCLVGEDVLATIAAFEALGVEVSRTGTDVALTGSGGRFPAEPVTLDLGNSGTSMRLLAGLLAGRGVTAELTGDASLRRRPMERVAAPLRSMGADVRCGPEGRPPVTIRPAGVLSAVDYTLPVASAQIKSALMLAALSARGTTHITQPAPSRDHTERMLGAFGGEIAVHGLRVEVPGPQTLRAADVDVPGDISSAAFFLVAATINAGSSLTLRGVGVNPTRTGVLDILGRMGADVKLANRRESGGEPVADLTVRAAPLAGIDIPRPAIPNAIDEFPALFVAAACARGTTVLRGAAELRVKESDRIASMAEGLARLGIAVEVFDDGMAVHGGRLGGGEVESYGDHRVAMAFAVAGSAAAGPVTVRDCAAVATSFPGFVDGARRAGLDITEQPA